GQSQHAVAKDETGEAAEDRKQDRFDQDDGHHRVAAGPEGPHHGDVVAPLAHRVVNAHQNADAGDDDDHHREDQQDEPHRGEEAGLEAFDDVYRRDGLGGEVFAFVDAHVDLHR